MNLEPIYEDVDETGKAIQTANNEATELIAKPTSFDSIAFVNPNDIPDLETAEEGFNVSPQYYEFKNAGDKVRAIYNGMTTIISTKNNERREIPTVVFQNKHGVYINSGANLVNQMRNLRAGTPVQITFTGQEKTSGGNNINKFEVFVLNIGKSSSPALKTGAVPEGLDKQGYVNLFWGRANELNYTKEQAQAILKKHDNDFKAAAAELVF